MPHRFRFVRSAIAVGTAVLLGAAGAAGADDYKIGVINTDRILRESAPAKDALKRIEQEFAAREANVAKLDRELRELTSRLDREGPTMTEADRYGAAARGRGARPRSRAHAAPARRGPQVAPVRRNEQDQGALDTVLTRLAKEQGYDLILQDGLYVRRTVDITDSVIKALEAK